MNFSEFYDITVSIREGLAVWPGDPALEIAQAGQLEAGDVANVSMLHMGSHVGTHMDAPRHFIEGSTGVDEMPLSALVGTVLVVEIEPEAGHISAIDLEKAGLPAKFERILFKTRNSQIWENGAEEFHPDYIALAPSGAEWLVERGVRLVGIDYLSIEQYDTSDYRTHHILLAQGIIIVEGLDLRAVAAGEYTLLALPLKIKQGDGAPARVVLVR